MLKKATLLVLTLGVALSFVVPVHAQETPNNQDLFSTDLTIRYTVSETGLTRVTNSFEITNLTPQFFISEYALTVGSGNVDNIRVTSQGDNVEFQEVETSTQTVITLQFPEPVAGAEQTKQFQISYTTPDLAQAAGQTLEVAVPPLAQDSNLNSYQVIIETPRQYGPPSRSNIEPSSVDQQPGPTIVTYNQPPAESIALVYGQEQFFEISLYYQLDNDRSQPALMQIALPPDTTYQQLTYHNLDPLPQEMTTDADGNWIATYRVAANTSLNINTKLTAHLQLDPFPSIPQPAVLPDYTQPTSNWPRLDAALLANTTPRSVYDWTIAQLEYDLEKIGPSNIRLGAVGSLQQPEFATCQEYTDVFTAMARSIGIPTRRLTGYAYSQQPELRPLSLVEDILHAWPEFYDTQSNQWRQIDPTWGDTTGGVDYFNHFDLNHIVFAINGVDDTQPFPAGSYQPLWLNSKDVSVEFGTRPQPVEFAATTNLQPQWRGYGQWLGKYSLEITNQTGRAWFNVPIIISSGEQLLYQRTLPVLLPFQTQNISLSLNHDQLLPIANTGILTLNDSQSQTIEFIQGPRLPNFIYQPVFWIGMGGSVVILTLSAGSVLVSRRVR